MNLDYERLSSAWIITFIISLLPIFAPQEYQFCTGTCTGNLSNCWCFLIGPHQVLSFYLWLPVLLGLSYYYAKAKPTFFTLLAVAVILLITAFIVTSIASILYGATLSGLY